MPLRSADFWQIYGQTIFLVRSRHYAVAFGKSRARGSYVTKRVPFNRVNMMSHGMTGNTHSGDTALNKQIVLACALY